MQTQRVSIIVTKTCTLACRLCGALAPYVKEYNPPFDFLKREIDAFFGIVRKTEIVDISGGEPFLCGGSENFSLGETLLYLRDSYLGRFDRIRVFTNGTIVPSNALCDVFRDVSRHTSLSITIDDYGRFSPKIDAITEKLQGFGVAFVVRDYTENIHCDGWVDLRDLSKKHNLPEAGEMYRKCAIPQKLGCCLELMDGVMTPCSVVAARYLCGELDAGSDDVIELFIDPGEAKQKLQGILTAECFASCQYCDGGMADDSRRFIPAEQATQDEIAQWRDKHAMRILGLSRPDPDVGQ